MMRGLRGLAHWLWVQRRNVVLGLLALIASDACLLLIPMYVKHAVDAVTAGSTLDAVRAPVRVIVLLAGLTVGARFAWRHFLFTGARLAEAQLRERLLAHALALPASYYSQTKTGEIMALATSDLQAVRMALAMGLVAGLDATAFALVALIALASMDAGLMLWTALPLPLLGAIMFFSMRRTYRHWDELQTSFERLTEKARESISGMRVLRAYAQEEGDLADFERYNQENREQQVAFARVGSFFQPAIAALAGASTAILLGVGGARVVRGELGLGAFTAFSSYLAMLTWPMMAAGWMASLVQRGAASMARVLDFLEMPPEEDARGDGPPIRGGLEARGLTFTYPGTDRPALRDVSFRVEPGGSLGVVGEVGSGKSTLALLLSRVYDPPDGELFVDGIDVNCIDRAHLRRNVSVVAQESFLFSESIADNLRLGDAAADDARVEALCRRAAVHDEIEAFPEGYRTPLGERGVTLSGGQRQRVSLARALLKPAPILVLDDTLSAVDADTEARILHQLETQARQARATRVVIAHRLSAVRDADQIIVLRGGAVVEQGRHDDLVARPGYYRELFELQQLEGAS